MSLPFVSVIVPTRDRPRALSECVRALANLDYPRDRFEVIVVDDGGTETMPPLPAHAPGVALTVLRRSHAGPGAARNTGARRARGSYLAFTDDDCHPARDWLSAYVRAAEALPGRTMGGPIVNGLGGNIYSEASQLLIGLLYAHHNEQPDDGRFFTTNNLFVPTALFRRVGGFDTKALRETAEDRELVGRLRRLGHRLAFTPTAVVFHRHPLSLASFWRQQFQYGRGAVYFHRVRKAREGEATRPLPASFFLSLLRAPFRYAYLSRGVLLALLLVLSQVAYAAGFLHEHILSEAGEGLPAVKDDDDAGPVKIGAVE